MNKNLKKGLIIGGITLDVAITVFLFVVSIIMLATMPKDPKQGVAINGPFIGYLQAHGNDVYLPFFVVPLFVLLIANIAILVIYVKKAGKTKAVEVADLDDSQKEALKAALLKDLQASSNKEGE